MGYFDKYAEAAEIDAERSRVRLRVVARKHGIMSWEGIYTDVGAAIAVAEKDNGSRMHWSYREATKSYKTHGVIATYIIEPAENKS